MRTTSAIVAAAAIVPAAFAWTTTTQGGKAQIQNHCSKSFTLNNTPADNTANPSDNPASVSQTMQPNNANPYSQSFISLDVAGGWSLKLYNEGTTSSPMQFEYTWTGDNNLWYDVSFVDSNYADFSSWAVYVNGVQQTQKYYRNPTDDAFGMYPAATPADTVLLVLCTENYGSSSSSSSSSSPASSAAAVPVASSASSAAPVAPVATTPSVVTTAPAPSTTLATIVSTTPAAPAPTSTTAAPVAPAKAASNNGAAVGSNQAVGDQPEIVTEYATKVVTAVVTETAHAHGKRHEHRHPHGHHAF